MKVIAISIFLFLTFNAVAQNIAKQDALDDLTFFNEAVIKGHPANYEANNAININSVIATINSFQKDSMSFSHYKFLLGEALYQVGCVHTAVQSSSVRQAKSVTFFPFALTIIKDKLFVTNDSIYNLAGKEISAINGMPAKSLISTMLQFRGSDGGGSAFAEAFFHKLFPALIALYFDYPADYTILVDTTIRQVNAVKDVVKLLPYKTMGELILKNDGNTLSLKKGVGILRIVSFAKSDKGFFKSAMGYINQNDIETLVIDLRQNTGGNRKAAITLTKYLVDTTFTYSILQPRLKTYHYVNGKGKFYLLLSMLKYNVGNALKAHRTPLGRAFNYKYKPNANPFTGKLYLITDGLTASSSTMVTSWLKQHTDALFVGKQAGGGYNGNNGGSFPVLTLPKSRLQITFPAFRLILDPASPQRSGLVPDIETFQSIDALLQNKDVEMDTIFTLVNKKQP